MNKGLTIPVLDHGFVRYIVITWGLMNVYVKQQGFHINRHPRDWNKIRNFFIIFTRINTLRRSRCVNLR